jgi:hypothetical protein
MNICLVYGLQSLTIYMVVLDVKAAGLWVTKPYDLQSCARCKSGGGYRHSKNVVAPCLRYLQDKMSSVLFFYH